MRSVQLTAPVLRCVHSPNAPVHRAAALDFPFQSRTARGSVCNGLFGDFFGLRGRVLGHESYEADLQPGFGVLEMDANRIHGEPVPSVLRPEDLVLVGLA